MFLKVVNARGVDGGGGGGSTHSFCRDVRRTGFQTKFQWKLVDMVTHGPQNLGRTNGVG